MRCCVPFCNSTANNAARADAITFHDFPSDVTLRMKWLRAIGKHDQPFKESAVICSQHFLDDEFCNIEGGRRQVRSGVIPSAVKLCMICLHTDRFLVSLSKYNLEDAYEKLIGHSICQEGYVKQTLCRECAQHLINFEKFRSKSLRARSVMMDLVKIHGTVTLQHIKQIDYMRELFKADIDKPAFAPDHCNMHVKQYNYEDVPTNPGNIVLSDVSVAIKSENYEGVLDGSAVAMNSKKTNDDDGGCLNDMDEALYKEMGLCKSIKIEYSVYSDDGCNAHNDDTRHAECGSGECDVQLAHRTHTELHSQHRESNQDMGDYSSADYSHTSVYILPTPMHEMTLEKKNTKDGKAENFQPLDTVNKTEFKFVEIVTDNLQVNNVIGISETLKKHNFREYFCEHCEYKCSKRNDIVKHLKSHTFEERFLCSSCNRVFKSEKSLASHMRIHTDEKLFSCKLCEYACRLKGNLVKHMKIHTGEKPFACKLCAYACNRKHNLVSHLRIHTGEKPFSCKFCEYACKVKSNLVQHMRIHTGEQPFTCKLCEYACRQKGDLVKHMRIHTGEKPFSCKLCQYACRLKGDLVRHMRIHTGEKPFPCKLCEYACRKKEDLVRHMRIHTGEKPFPCKLCEYACREKGNLVKHMKVHSGENLSRVKYASLQTE